MKVLLLTNSSTPTSGWGRYGRDIARALRARGVGIGMSMDAPDDLSSSNRVMHCSLPSPTSYRRIALVWWWYAVVLYAKHWREFRTYDVIHCCIESYVSIAWGLSVLSGKPCVLTAHGSFALTTLRQPLLAPLQRFVYRRVARIICVSRYTEAKLLSEVSGLRTLVIHNGVDVENFAAPGVSTREHLMITVGAVKYRKGCHHVIEALPAIQTRVPDVRYTIVGFPDEKEYVATLKRRITELNLESVVEWRSGISDEDLRTLYARASVFVMAPVSTPDEFEGFGLVYLEANAMGLPVVGMRGSGAAEAISNGISGIVVDENDVGGLARAVTSILTDRHEAERLSVGGKRWAHEHAWSTVAGDMTEVYVSARYFQDS